MAKIFTVCIALVALLVITTNEVESRCPHSQRCRAREYRQAIGSQGSYGSEGLQQMENRYPTVTTRRIREDIDYDKNSIREELVNVARVGWNSEIDRTRRIRQDADYVMNNINEKLSSARNRHI